MQIFRAKGLPDILIVVDDGGRLLDDSADRERLGVAHALQDRRKVMRASPIARPAN